MHKVLRVLILSDLFILSSFGLIQPIFAVFMLRSITGTTLTAIGIATTIQLVTKGIFQLLIARWTDAERGNRREQYTLLFGSMIMSFVPLGYIFIDSLALLYILQFVYGLGAALAFPGWTVMFTRYLHDEEIGYEWGTYSTVVGFGAAAAAAIGGYVAEVFSFQALFVGASIISFIGATSLLYIFNQEFSERKERQPVK